MRLRHGATAAFPGGVLGNREQADIVNDAQQSLHVRHAVLRVQRRQAELPVVLDEPVAVVVGPLAHVPLLVSWTIKAM